MNDVLLDPARVVGDYLDEMLRVATETPARPDSVRRPAVLLLPELVSTPAAPEIRPEPAGRGLQDDHVNHRAARDTLADDADPAEFSSPDFQFPLQCMTFRIGPHALAMPLVGLGSVQRFEQSPVRLPGSPAWLLGMVDIRGEKLAVVDGLQLLTDGEQRHEGYSHLLVLERHRFALSCDRIEQVVTVEAGQVHWGRRNLLAGTLRDSLAGLLDPGAILRRLEAAAETGFPADRG